MSEGLDVNTPVAGETVQPVTETEVQRDQKSEVEVEAPKGPSLEAKEGKFYVDGKRVYTREETDRIAVNAKKDVESRILQDLEVDDLGQVKQVVNQLRSASPENNSLDVEALKSAVQKREQTVEELKLELSKVKTDYAVREHISTLKENMPTTWKPEQKDAVVDLMKARDMFQVEGQTFAIKNGEDYLTVDGEKPDYKTAVEVVGKSLGLPFAKKGVDTYDVDTTRVDQGKQIAVDETRMKRDPEYRSAFVNLRTTNRSLSRNQISDQMVRKHIDKMRESRNVGNSRTLK
jgi:predicted NUDIX family NTP pyrophosphohydrolase